MKREKKILVIPYKACSWIYPGTTVEKEVLENNNNNNDNDNDNDNNNNNNHLGESIILEEQKRWTTLRLSESSFFTQQIPKAENSMQHPNKQTNKHNHISSK